MGNNKQTNKQTFINYFQQPINRGRHHIIHFSNEEEKDFESFFGVKFRERKLSDGTSEFTVKSIGEKSFFKTNGSTLSSGDVLIRIGFQVSQAIQSGASEIRAIVKSAHKAPI